MNKHLVRSTAVFLIWVLALAPINANAIPGLLLAYTPSIISPITLFSQQALSPVVENFPRFGAERPAVGEFLDLRAFKSAHRLSSRRLLPLFRNLNIHALSQSPVRAEKLPHDYEIETFHTDTNSRVMIVKVAGDARLAIVEDQTAGVYRSIPLTPVINSNEAQHYLEVVYNTLNLRFQAGLEDLQVQDAVVKRYFRQEYQDVVASGKVKRGLMDRMDIYQTLAEVRRTIPPSRPVYKKPTLSQPVRMVLQASPGANNIESPLIRQLMGDADIDLRVVVGYEKPSLLFNAIHGSRDRLFLFRRDFDFNDAEGWIRIYNKKIRVVNSWDKLTPQDLAGITTVVGADSLGTDTEAIYSAFGRNDMDMLSMQVPHAPLGKEGILVSEFAGVLPQFAATDGTSSTRTSSKIAGRLAESHAMIPVLFLKAFAEVNSMSVADMTNAHFTVESPVTNQFGTLDESGRKPGGAFNLVPISGKDLLASIRAIGSKALALIHRFVREPQIKLTPTQVGTVVTVEIRINKRTARRCFDLRKATTNDQVREKLIGMELRKITERNPIFQLTDDPSAVVTDTRGKNTVFIHTPQIKVTDAGSGASSDDYVIEIPLYFENAHQDARHLIEVLHHRGAARSASLKTSAVRDLRVSDYQSELNFAMERGTLPPVRPELPRFITLTDGPLNIAVVGAGGRTGGIMVRSLIHELNLRMVAVTGPLNAEEWASALHRDSTHGIWTNNGQEVRLDKDSSSSTDDVVGKVSINGRSIPIIKREKDPAKLNWGLWKVDMVVDATGTNVDPKNLRRHVEGPHRPKGTGAKMAIVSAPWKATDSSEPLPPTYVYGITNDLVEEDIAAAEEAGQSLIASNASCTTNCGAHVLNALDVMISPDRVRAILASLGVHNDKAEAKVVGVFGITVHAMTNTQVVADSFGKTAAKDVTRGRGSINSINPTTTGLGVAILQLRKLAHLAVHLLATSDRVPNDTGSHLVINATVMLKHLTAKEKRILAGKSKELQNAFQKLQIEVYDELTRSDALRGVVFHAKDDQGVTSSQIAGIRAAAVFDSQQVMVGYNAEEAILTIPFWAWYDNETGYSTMLARMVNHIALVLDKRARNKKTLTAA